jgi:hypothetical protein
VAAAPAGRLAAASIVQEVRKGVLVHQIAQAQALGLFTQAEAQWLIDYDKRVMHLINVDDFAPHELGAAPANTGVPT